MQSESFQSGIENKDRMGGWREPGWCCLFKATFIFPVQYALAFRLGECLVIGVSCKHLAEPLKKKEGKQKKDPFVQLSHFESLILTF